MTTTEITDIIAKEQAKFNDTQWEGLLPDWLLNNFDEILMVMPQIHAPYNFQQMDSVLGKIDNPSLLTNYEVGWVCNVLQAIPPNLIAEDMNAFRPKKRVIANIAWNYQMKFEKEQRRLKLKEATLIQGLRKNDQQKIFTP